MTPAPRTREITGTAVGLVDYETTLDLIDGLIEQRRRGYICCAPTHALMAARRDGELRAALDGATLVTPDGMPVVWAARLLGERLTNRVYGPDLMLMQCSRAVASGHRVWLHGGFDDAALAALRAALIARFPDLRIVGGESPPHRSLGASEDVAAAKRIDDARPDIVWVGLGMPKQEKWMARMRPLLEAPVLCGVGAAFDIHAGRVQQAPRWMQNNGLEWLFRVLREPRRLGLRYAVNNPAFVRAVIGQLIRERRSRARS